MHVPFKVVSTKFGIVLSIVFLWAIGAKATAQKNTDNDLAPAADKPSIRHQSAATLRHLRDVDKALTNTILPPRSRARATKSPVYIDFPNIKQHLRDLYFRLSTAHSTNDPALENKVMALQRAAHNLEFEASVNQGSAISSPAKTSSTQKFAQSPNCESANSVSYGNTTIDYSNAHKSAWLLFTPKENTPLSINTFGTKSDTLLSVYEGCPTSERDIPIAANDDSLGLQSSVSISAHAGQQYAIEIGSHKANKNLQVSLVTGASISGRIGRLADGRGIRGVLIELFDSQGRIADTAVSDDDGLYMIAGLADGTYYASTKSTIGRLLDELYDDIPCAGGAGVGCNAVSGTPLTITNGESLKNVEFIISKGGRISGRVRDIDGLPVPDVWVDVWNQSGERVSADIPDSAGRYTAGGLGPENYFVTVFVQGYLGEAYDDVVCIDAPNGGCDPTTGDPIQVTRDVITPDINFELAATGTISGAVSENSTGEPIPFASITVRDAEANLVMTIAANEFGQYETGGLLPGSYFLIARGFSNFQNELFDNVPCLNTWSCDYENGTPIAVPTETTVTGIDFALDRYGSISGTITSAVDQLPLADAFVAAWRSDGTRFDTKRTDENGFYEFEILPSDDYFIVASASDYAPEVYADVPCPLIDDEIVCDPLSGSPISVTVETDTSGIDIELNRFGIIRGRMTDSGSRLPIESGSIEFWDSTGELLFTARTDENGFFDVLSLDENRTYFARSNNKFYIDKLFDNLPCAEDGQDPVCDPLKGKPINVGSNEIRDGVDFSLVELGTISGSVTDQFTGEPLRAGSIVVYPDQESRGGRSDIDEDGNYLVRGLAPGNYFVVHQSAPPYLDEVYDSLPCVGEIPDDCDPSIGTRVFVDLDNPAKGINFSLIRGSGISGAVTTIADQTPIPGTAIDVWNAKRKLIETTSTDIRGKYAVLLEPGTYFVSTDNGYGLLDKVYRNVICVGGPAIQFFCDPTEGTPIEVTEGPVVGGIDFSLGVDFIFGSNFEADLATR